MKFVIMILICALTFAGAFAQTELDWKDLKKGTYEIGFSVNHVYDSSRSFGNMDKRPLQISIWYPAMRNSDSLQVHYEYYLNLSSSTIDFSAIGKEHFTTKPVIKKYGIHGNTLMKAKYNAEIATGTFPVILFIPGNNSKPTAYFILLEYLASHGFIIVSSPSMGHNEERGSPESELTLKARLNDTEFLLKYLKHLPTVDASKIGLLGHSAGGLTMIMLASKMQHPINAIISMDGSEGGLQNPFKLVKNELLPAKTMQGIVYKICIAGKKGSTVTTWPTLKVLSLFENQNAEAIVFDKLGHEHFTSSPVYNADSAKWDDYSHLCQYIKGVFKNQLQ